MVQITPELLAKSGTEDGEQAALFCFASEIKIKKPLWNLLYSIPNGGLRTVVTATRIKATGAKAGFPDVGLPVARHDCHGLFIEMKRKLGGRIATNQTYWHTKLNEQGYAVVVCYGWEHARDTIEAYLDERIT